MNGTHLIVFATGLLLGAAALFLIARARHVRELKKRAEHEADKVFNLISHRIWNQNMPTFPETIQRLSPTFCEIYGEASAAERGELRQVCGPAYRKSLEFLIKDYAKRAHPSRQKEIEAAPLGACIKTFVADPSIRDSAELAAWLRNDEAHYVKKWIDKDVSDLKQLIFLIVTLIESAEQRTRMDQNVEEIRQGFSTGPGPKKKTP